MGYTIGLLRESKMPWKECNPMDERLKFIARLLPHFALFFLDMLAR